ncbi:MAG: cysteine desulfurase [Hyphomicrobiales bacterium]|nr:cysteine desulfurase [Hyphomicrobiales bacterium]
MVNSVYLDHNATTPLRPEALAAMTDALRATGNPSSVHRHGQRKRAIVEDARERVAELVGATPAGVMFTSGGTEANATALRSFAPGKILVAATEHASVLENVQQAHIVPVDRHGVVDLDTLERMLFAQDEPVLVAVMLANNETGIIQPIADVVDVAHRYGARVHCDAVQAAGKMPIDLGTLGVDSLSLSAHKFGGPMGAGALVFTPDARIRPLLRGGGQERRLRAGTENVPGIAGFGAAASAVGTLPDAVRLSALRSRMEQELGDSKDRGIVIGAGAPRLPNTTCLAMPGVPAETQVIAFDLAGYSVSAGSACSSGTVKKSHVLDAMAVDRKVADCAIRISTGWTTTEQDIISFISAWRGLRARHDTRSQPELISA